MFDDPYDTTQGNLVGIVHDQVIVGPIYLPLFLSNSMIFCHKHTFRDDIQLNYHKFIKNKDNQKIIFHIDILCVCKYNEHNYYGTFMYLMINL